jgi:glycerate kinase
MPSTVRPPIPQHLLIAGEPFGARLSASAVIDAIARGVQAQGWPEPDLCALPGPSELNRDPRELLDSLNFDARMRSARAVILAAARLAERALAGSLAFEIATRARQAGVPAYTVTAHNELNRFDQRILDLQTVTQARSAEQLTAAGEQIANSVGPILSVSRLC